MMETALSLMYQSSGDSTLIQNVSVKELVKYGYARVKLRTKEYMH
jgi:hypothetical protein